MGLQIYIRIPGNLIDGSYLKMKNPVLFLQKRSEEERKGGREKEQEERKSTRTRGEGGTEEDKRVK